MVISRDNQDEDVYNTNLMQIVLITKYTTKLIALIHAVKLTNYPQFSEFQQKLFFSGILKEDCCLNIWHFAFHL